MKQSFILVAVASGFVFAAGSAFAADAAAGKATFEQSCASCHELVDWKGKSEADMSTMIKDVVAGKVKHKKAIKLEDAEIANVSAFVAANAK